MKVKVILAALLILTFPTTSLAATKPLIPLTALAPTVITNFSGGDQVSAISLSSTAIYLVGTVENISSNLMTTPSLGGSDGFVLALSPSGSKLWELRLGGSGDDVANAIAQDATGNLWIAGASTNGTAIPAPGLNRINVWEVSSQGALINTFSRDSNDVSIPTRITAKNSKYILQGITSKAGFQSFAATLDPLAKIGSLNYSPSALPSPSPTKTAISAVYSWQSYITSGPIKGVLGMTPHQSIPVLTHSGLKDKALKGASAIVGNPIDLQYQNGVGLVLLSQGSGTYYVTIIHTK